MGNEATTTQSDEQVDMYMGLSLCLSPRPLPLGAKYILYPAKKTKRGEHVNILTALWIWWVVLLLLMHSEHCATVATLAPFSDSQKSHTKSRRFLHFQCLSCVGFINSCSCPTDLHGFFNSWVTAHGHPLRWSCSFSLWIWVFWESAVSNQVGASPHTLGWSGLIPVSMWNNYMAGIKQ